MNQSFNIMVEDEFIRIGCIKFFDDKGYGFIIDFLDNAEYYFHKSFLKDDILSNKVVSYKIRKSQRNQDKHEAYDIATLYHYKEEIKEKFDVYPKEIQKIIQLHFPSLLYKYNDTYMDRVKELIDKYDRLIAELCDYVRNFDIEEFLKSYFVKTSFFCSSSTKDWDINSLSYQSYLVEPYTELKSIYQRCVNYEESLVCEYYQSRWYIYQVFDPYVDKISSKSQEIKSTTAYGYDTYFWKDLNKEEIEALIPQITDKWKAEIRQAYNKKDHFNALIQELRSRYYSIKESIPTVIDQGEETTHINIPRFDVTLNFPNGSIRFQTISCSNETQYGYRITRQFNEKTTLIIERDLNVSDEDFIRLKQRIEEVKSKASEMFQNMLLKHQVL